MVTSPRIPAEVNTNMASPAAQAEQACAVVAVLGRLEDRVVADARSAGDAGVRPRPLRDPRPLTELVAEVARSECRPGLDAALVADLVTRELARGLPLALRLAARSRPRWALSLHDERGGERRRTLDLVRATHRRLGGAPRHPSARGRRPGAD